MSRIASLEMSPFDTMKMSARGLGILLSLGCTSVPAREYGHSSTTSTAPETASSDRIQPRSDTPASAHESPGGPTGTATARLEPLPVSGFETAVAVVPPGSGARPLLVSAHGAGGDSEWQCERWGALARGRWFVLCPTGTPLNRREPGSYYYADHLVLEREVTAVVSAARARYGSRIATTEGVYAGYSQGATMGALMVVEHGAEFPHLLLIEGGSGDWTLKRARRFQETGGRSVFIVCGTPACARRATASVSTLERAGLLAKAEYAEGGGHTELGEVGERATRLLESLVIPQP